MKNFLAAGLFLLATFGQSYAEYEYGPPKPKPTKTPKGPKTTTTASLTTVTTPSATPSRGPSPPGGESRIGIIVYPGFTPMDVFGPLEALQYASFRYYLNLSIIAETLDPVRTQGDKAWFTPMQGSSFYETINPTHTYETANFPLDLLIVPGGGGTRAPNPYLNSTVDFIKKAYPQSKYVLSVCTGALLTARSGIINGKRSTTNKRAWSLVTSNGPLVKWVAVARWVIDGNIWSSSGVSAGTDATLAWINHVFGNETANFAAGLMEWTGDWKNSENDPYAAINGLTSANNTNGA